MPTFNYTARTRQGQRVEGSVDAPDRRAAAAQIERLGHVPVLVAEGAAPRTRAPRTAAATARAATAARASRRLGGREVLLFTTELSDLLSSGMTLGNALNALARRAKGPAQEHVLGSLREQIVQGVGLSAALAEHPRTFTPLYVSMIRAGEASGALPEVLRRLVTHYERIQEVREKILMALVYPGIVLTLGAATLVFSVVYVVPKFQVIFKELGGTLPVATRILLAISAWLARYGWAALILIVLAAIFFQRAIQTRRGRLLWDGFKLRVPLIRGIVASGIYTNFARTLATLLGNGVPVLQALGIVEQTVGNAVIAREIRNARDRVTDGTSVSGPLAAGKVFPPIMTDMLAIGEQTGDITGALNHIARRFEGQLDRNVKIFTTALEPMLIVVVAIMVGFVAISILTAVFNLTSGLGV